MADLVTVLDTTRTGLALELRADTMTSNIRGRHARAEAVSNECNPFHLADILPLTVPVPALDLAPTTRVIWPDSAHPGHRGRPDPRRVGHLISGTSLDEARRAPSAPSPGRIRKDEPQKRRVLHLPR